MMLSKIEEDEAGVIDVKLVIERASAFSNRVRRVCSSAMPCPKCRSRQVQLLGDLHPLAKWKCRECQYKFVYEPLVRVKCG